MIDLSIIIPIYNTPIDKLKRCLDSIKLESNISYEVLLIDDGSKLYIETVCKEYINNYKNYKYVKKQNEGVSETRNLGINKAQGKYIMFVDADDEVQLETIKKESFNKKYNLIIFNYMEVVDKKEKIIKILDTSKNNISLNTVINTVVNTCNLNTVWAKLYDINYIKKNQIKFDKTMIEGEDLNFICDILLANPKIYYYDKEIYKCHVEKQNGLNRIKKYPDTVLKDIDYMINKLKKLVDNHINNPKEKEYLYQKINKRKILLAFSCACDLSNLNKLNKSRKLYIKNIVQDQEKNITYISNFSTNYKLRVLQKENSTLIKILSIGRNLKNKLN